MMPFFLQDYERARTREGPGLIYSKSEFCRRHFLFPQQWYSLKPLAWFHIKFYASTSSSTSVTSSLRSLFFQNPRIRFLKLLTLYCTRANFCPFSDFSFFISTCLTHTLVLLRRTVFFSGCSFLFELVRLSACPEEVFHLPSTHVNEKMLPTASNLLLETPDQFKFDPGRAFEKAHFTLASGELLLFLCLNFYLSR